MILRPLLVRGGGRTVAAAPARNEPQFKAIVAQLNFPP